MKKNEREEERPQAYPQPTETDRQLQHQPEFIDEKPNEFDDQSVSDVPDVKVDEQRGTEKNEGV